MTKERKWKREKVERMDGRKRKRKSGMREIKRKNGVRDRVFEKRDGRK